MTPDAPTDDSVQAAYEVVVSLHREDAGVEYETPVNLELARAVEAHQSEIESDLTRRAVERFGPAYMAGLRGPLADASIRFTVALVVRYPVRAAAVAVDEFRRFVGEIEVAVAESLEPAVPGTVKVSAELDEASVAEAADTAETKTPWDRTAAVLAAVGTGIGVLGFVTFVGGAVEWARFHAAGLPEQEALSVVPTHDLVIVGARTLVPAIGIGLLACAYFFIFRLLAGKREERIPDPSNRTVAERHPAATRAISVALLIIVFEAITAAMTFSGTILRPGPGAYVITIFLAPALVALAVGIALITDRFLYLATTLFVALSLFLVVMEVIQAYTTPALRGSAVVRQDKKAEIGFFVGENSDRVYLARLDTGALEQGILRTETARLIGIDKTQISDLAIGPPKTNFVDALNQARALADELCASEIPPTKQSKVKKCWHAPPGVQVR